MAQTEERLQNIGFTDLEVCCSSRKVSANDCLAQANRRAALRFPYDVEKAVDALLAGKEPTSSPDAGLGLVLEASHLEAGSDARPVFVEPEAPAAQPIALVAVDPTSFTTTYLAYENTAKGWMVPACEVEQPAACALYARVAAGGSIVCGPIDYSL